MLQFAWHVHLSGSHVLFWFSLAFWYRSVSAIGLQVGVLLVRQRHLCGVLHLLLVLLHGGLVNLHLRRGESWGRDELLESLLAKVNRAKWDVS